MQAKALQLNETLGSLAVIAPKMSPVVLERITDVEGWLTDDQAERLFQRASELHIDAQIIEIGSFRGRSLIVLASGAPTGVEVVSIDPHAGGDRGPQEIAPDLKLGDRDHAAFVGNLERAGVGNRIRHIRKTSQDAHADINGEINLLYIDGAHRFKLARHDIVAWGDRVAPDGTMLIHDAFSSIGVTLALLTAMFVNRHWRYVGRCGSLVEYRRQSISGLALVKNTLSQVLQLGWFVRNVIVKATLLLRLYPLARLLGHTTRDWPY